MKEDETNWIEVLNSVAELEEILEDKKSGGEKPSDNT